MRIQPKPSKRELSDRLENAAATVHLLEAVATALADPHAVLDLVLRAQDADEATALVMARFHVDAEQAEAMLNTQFRRASVADRRGIEAVLREARAALDSTT